MSEQGPPPAVAEVLLEARSLGFLGPGPVAAHIDHAAAYADVIGTPPATALDLGSGGGVPGLILAMDQWAETRWVLLDAGERRCAFLQDAVDRLGLSDRATVVRARAEEAGRDPDLRHGSDVVVARSFGAPAVTAECGAPFLRLGGRLVVSDPPTGDGGRWDTEGLGLLGLEPVTARSDGWSLSVFAATSLCPDTYPRPVGRPGKRPLF